MFMPLSNTKEKHMFLSKIVIMFEFSVKQLTGFPVKLTIKICLESIKIL